MPNIYRYISMAFFYGAKSICPVNNRIMVIIQKMKNDDDNIKEITGIVFFSVFLNKAIAESTMPTPVSTKVI